MTVPVPAETDVAERLYYDAQALIEFDAEVTTIREVARVNGRQVWQLALDRTAFYPAGGGQPFDGGVLVATARSGASLQVPITGVMEDEAGEVWHTTAKPLQEGTTVRGIVDAERRRDHMQQHSGQHLLSAVLRRDSDVATVSFHLGPETSTIDVSASTISDEALAGIERDANAAIARALPISTRLVSRSEAESLLTIGLLHKLPSRSGAIRLVEIPGLDLNACGGTHVANTAEIGPLLLRGTEKVRGLVRLSFVCGKRALTASRKDFQQLTSMASSLSTGNRELTAAVGKLLADGRASAKERIQLLHSLAEAESRALNQASSSLFIHELDARLPGRDAVYAKLLSACLVAGPATCALVVAREGEHGSVAMAAKPGGVDCGTVLRAALSEFEGKGGGGREQAQGALPLSNLDRFLAVICSSVTN